MASRNTVFCAAAGATALAAAALLFRVWSPAPTTDAPAGAVPERKPVVGFNDQAQAVGLQFQMGFLPGEQGENFKINLYDHGCGLAVGDYNGDGHEDLYFLNQLGPNALYRNRGDGTFEDVTAQMGVALDDRVCVGATFADYDNDGDQDLYVTSTRGGNVLYRNEDNQHLLDVTETAGLQHVGHSQTAVFFDYDNNGLLDLYLVQTSEWTKNTFDNASRYYPGKGESGGLEGVVTAPKEYNILYRNNGNGTFTDITQVAGLQGRGWSGDVAVFDYDEDGWQDLLVVCMFGRAQLYRNQGNGTFADVTLEVLGRTPFGGIGTKVFDFNNDGRLDIYIVDMHSDMWMGLDYDHASLRTAVESEKIKFDYCYGPKVEGSPEFQRAEAELEPILDFRHAEVIFGNAFYQNLGNGKFQEISAENNLETFWPWGIGDGDFDNNGFVDVFVASGMGYPFYYWHNYLLMNDGSGVYNDRSFALGIEPPVGGEFLPDQIKDTPCPRSSRCAVTADFDHDGRLELVTNNFNHGPYYFHNDFAPQNFLKFKLRGTRSNRDAICAQVRLTAGDQVLVRQVNPAGGYLSHSSKVIHFGLADRTEVGDVEILWPSGLRQIISNPEINKLHEIVEPDENAREAFEQ